MVVYRIYDFHLVDVLLDVVCLFLLFQIYIRVRSLGGIDCFRAFELRDGCPGAGRRGSMAFHGDCRLDDLFAAHGGNREYDEDFRFADARHDDAFIHRSRGDLFAGITDI